MPGTRPRIVLVEDDPAMQLYVQTALQHLPIELVCCQTVRQAWQALLDAPARLLIADLMLGGESGLSLIERVRAGPIGLRATRVAVTSAASDAPGVRERLQALEVWQLLQKPVGLDTIEACVRDALEDDTTSDTLPSRPTAQSSGSRHTELDPARAAAVIELFGGDGVLYGRYREACLAQFPVDVMQGDAGFANGDTSSVRRLAHNLRSVLRSLGEPASAIHADRLEAALAGADMPSAQNAWRSLRAALLRLKTPD